MSLFKSPNLDAIWEPEDCASFTTRVANVSHAPRLPMYVDFDLQNTPDGPLRDLYEYWLSLKGDDQVPRVEAFQLLDIPHLVANILIVEFCGQRMRCRYCGSSYVRETGRDPTGLFVDEFHDVDDILERAQNCRETGTPFLVFDHPVTWTSRAFKNYSTVVLPLANAEGNVTRLVYILTFA